MTVQPLLRQLAIGSVLLPNNLALAPMAGTTDLAFRRICHRLGAGLTVTELVSARGMVHDPAMRRNWRYLAIAPEDGAMGIQLFGSEPDDFTEAIARILDHPTLRRCSLIDINMGCPVKKVVAGGSGCALMRNPEKAMRIVKAAVREAERAAVPITVKCRSGWDEGSVNAPQFARALADAGAAAITIHGRTGRQMYSGRADWSVIAATKQAVTVPVFGNGDVKTASDARKMLLETGVDGLMIGRAAQGNPWVFSQIAHDLAGAAEPAAIPDVAERTAIVVEQLDGLAELLGEQTAVKEMRRHLAWYLRGAWGAAHLRSAGMLAVDRADLLHVLEEWRICSDKSCENS
jgi:nifR3 family TIM-barrel protein